MRDDAIMLIKIKRWKINMPWWWKIYYYYDDDEEK